MCHFSSKSLTYLPGGLVIGNCLPQEGGMVGSDDLDYL